MTILIIDDDDLIVEAAAEYLMKHDYHVETAREFDVARSVMLKRYFDVVLLDLHLTGGSVATGWEMVRWIRDQFPSTRIGVFASNGIAEESQRLGVSAVVRKPASIHAVLTAVNALHAPTVRPSETNH